VECEPGRDGPKKASFGTWTDVETVSRKKKAEMGLVRAKVLKRARENGETKVA